MSGVKLSSLKLYALKLALYTGGLLYIGADLFILEGPLWKMLHRNEAARHTQDESGLALSVYGEPTTAAQLKRRAAELAILNGENAPDKLMKTAMDDVIRNTLLRMRTRYNDSRIPDSRAEAEAELAALETRASDAEELEQQLRNQGYTREQFINRLTVIMRELHYLETVMEQQVQITDSEISSLIGQLEYYLVMPMNRKVRHIFFETLNKNPDEVKATAEAVLAQLPQQADKATMEAEFARLAQEHSEDLHTAPRGGDLGTISVYPAPALQELRLFGENAIAADTPVLLQSRWGWHILLAGEIQQPRPLSQEECRESIRTALLSCMREECVDNWINLNISEAKQKNRIQYHGN